ncbi:MFS transporter [Actinomycetospora sp. TBRC 11914]|uniref:MFS transporter n=1 Tax=Actinomycetospora sp. TBRC 11914 TaxID=2729387 RepID=UPI00145C85CD|nr:MFS transporter [Actinomycetospora sp. TBRC 11914]NMO90248.1 MFS transporter [Actinomycetospora sp. TBRC 11914]
MAEPTPPTPSSRVLWPLFAAGFVTAFGSHGVAANLGAGPGDLEDRLLTLGVLLALYDGAEVLLKPVFGALADRVGLRPVLLGGLAAFAIASTVFVLVDDPALLGMARFAQGAAASAFSPSAGALIARVGPRRSGRAFGTYGAWKSLGYTAGPLLGGALVALGGYPWLFGVLAALAVLVLAWAAVTVPGPAPLPRKRQTLADLARRLTDREFLPPTIALASSAAALSCAVGFLPVVGLRAGLSPIVTGAVISVLAVSTAVVQPIVGRLRDRGRLGDRTALTAGTLVTAAGLAAPAVLPDLAGLLAAALLVGLGTGLITPVGFALLAAGSPPARLGQTMGSAELGREAGEAGGPLLVGAVAALAGLGTGFLAVAAAVTVTAGSAAAVRTPASTASPSEDSDTPLGPTPPA